jgi:hypothetical protein
MKNGQTGVALRFLQYFAYAPDNIQYPPYVKPYLTQLNIAPNKLSIQFFVWKDLVQLREYPSPTPILTIHQHRQMAQLQYARYGKLTKMMEDFP